MLHQVDDVIARDAGQVDVLRKRQQDEDRDRPGHLPGSERADVCRGVLLLFPIDGLSVLLVPPREPDLDRDPHRRGDREPRQAALPVRQESGRSSAAARGRAEVAANLEHRLGQPVGPAGRQSQAEPGRFGDGRSTSRSPAAPAQQQHRVVRRVPPARTGRSSRWPCRTAANTWLRLAVGVETHQWLQQRRRDPGRRASAHRSG